MIEEKYQDQVKMLESIIKIIDKIGIRVVEMWDRHVKLLLPLEPNINHIGTIYAGSLFAIGEFIGEGLFLASFDHTRFYPIVKAINIQFRRPATTNVTVESTLSEVKREADAKGKADWRTLKSRTKRVRIVIFLRASGR